MPRSLCLAHAPCWDGRAAVARHFGGAAQGRVCASLDAVHAAVARGDCGLGLLPLESSTEGMVNRSHDLLFAGGVKVVGELLHESTAATCQPSCIRYGIIASPDHATDPQDDRLMMAVVLPRRTGSLLDMLAPFASRALSVEHWCSRPARTDGWHYRFHFTLRASAECQAVRQALQEVAEHCSDLRLLGRFRTSPPG